MSITFLTNEDEKMFVKSINGVKPDPVTGDIIINVPDSGGNADYVGVEPTEDDIPKVFIDGVKPTTKDDVLAEMQYISKTDSFHAYLKIKCQGRSSMFYPKKNFTVKMYSDDARETKLKKSFKDWNHNGNKYVLKANYIDHTHARNIVSARLWNEVVNSRTDYETLPVEMRTSPRNGAIDGFPVKVYYNGNYEGVYTWNIGKDDWMWGMDEDNANHALLCGEYNTNLTYEETACNFRALWSGVDGSNWGIEIGQNGASLKTALNNLIGFVMNNDGDNFRNGIGNYLDIHSAIDYYIHQYVICGLDGLAQNMLLATYDMTKWICGAYDMDSTFGLWFNGVYFVSAEYRCPEDYQEKYSLLWERIESVFREELRARYFELRKTVYSYSNMVTAFERFMDVIGLDLYAEDCEVYTGIPQKETANIKQLRNYIRDRLAYCDAEFTAMREPVPCTAVMLDKTILTFEDENPVTITATVSPEDTTDVLAWESSDETVATVENGIVTPICAGECTIKATCGSYSATCAVSVAEQAVTVNYVKSLVSSGTQYINTGLTLEAQDSYNIKFYDEPTADSTYEALCGVRTGNKIQRHQSTKYRVNSNALCVFNVTESNVYDVTINNATGSINWNGDTSKTFTFSDETVTNNASANNKMLLFASWKNSGEAIDAYGVCKIYEFTMLNGSGAEKIHLLPCLDANGVACMYDTVSRQYFYNAGTGAFEYEPLDEVTA